MWAINEQELRAVEATIAAAVPVAQDGGSVASVTNGDTMTVNVTGVLLPERNHVMTMFGIKHSSYANIQTELIRAEDDDSIKHITLNVDSPGGTVAGMFETADVLNAVTKPITAKVSGMAASAAYCLVSTADRIEAKSKSARFGSLGIVLDTHVDPSVVSVTSTNAPFKRKDVTTLEGKAAIVRELDAMHDMFADTVATGRGVTVEKVNSDFGKGGMFLAEEALKAGMIDEVKGFAGLPNLKTAALDSGTTSEVHAMNLEKLKSDHPAVYAAAVEIGETKGRDAERERVASHLTLGASSGDMGLAMAAVEGGHECGSLYQAKYQAAHQAALTAAALKADAGDNADTPPVVEGDEQTPEEARAALNESIFEQAGALAGITTAEV